MTLLMGALGGLACARHDWHRIRSRHGSIGRRQATTLNASCHVACTRIQCFQFPHSGMAHCAHPDGDLTGADGCESLQLGGLRHHFIWTMTSHLTTTDSRTRPSPCEHMMSGLVRPWTAAERQRNSENRLVDPRNSRITPTPPNRFRFNTSPSPSLLLLLLTVWSASSQSFI